MSDYNPIVYVADSDTFPWDLNVLIKKMLDNGAESVTIKRPRE